MLTIKIKTLRLKKMRLYKGLSEGEYLRQFYDVKIKFLNSSEYFLNNRTKIIYYMKSLEGDLATQQYIKFERINLEGVNFSNFKRFLLNLVIDPTNRRLFVYKKWKKTRQKSKQKIIVFKAYLEEVEVYLSSIFKKYRTNFFLAKLQPRLKDRILSTNNMPKLRKEILAIAIIQKKVSERVRRDSGNSSNSKSSGGQNSKGRSLESRVFKSNKSRSGDSGKPSQT